MDAPIHVAVLHASKLKADTLCRALGRMQDRFALTYVATLDETLQMVGSAATDLVLIDAGPDATSTIQSIKAVRADQSVIVWDLEDHSEVVLPMIEAGATGYIPRNAPLEDIAGLIEAVWTDRPVCSPQIVAAMFGRVWQLSRNHTRASHISEALSRREREILRLISLGLANKEIAHQLDLETCTVKNHVHRILEKLKVHRREEAVRQVGVDHMDPLAHFVQNRSV